MKKRIMLFLFVSILITSIGLRTAGAQEWNITGNNNAIVSSKLGASNLVSLKFFTNNNQREKLIIQIENVLLSKEEGNN